ncbi:MAG: excinuclease ABC subunit UvrC [Candidatus Pacebacteria bacterium]|nr:excinuclease ABC subunit UvrC [Candidatus Paceibacterota bacterium]
MVKANSPDYRPSRDASFKQTGMAEDSAAYQAEPAAVTASGVAPLGAEVIEEFVKTLPETPGVYRMIDRHGVVIYVGKAKSLKKRVVSYTQPTRLSIRIARMVALVARMEVVTTQTEAEALLLESNLIKRFMPRYNVLLRDDKSFPYIRFTDSHEFPLVQKYRGGRSESGNSFFGPFASGLAVNLALEALQKAFLLRNCSDSYFAARSRPCLQYQIKRCSAPCTGMITAEDYGRLVTAAKDFLRGKSSEIQITLSQLMEKAAESLDYELAARYRDRIRALTQVQSRQEINFVGQGDADVIALYSAGGVTCIQIFFFRGGSNYGNRSYFPRHDEAVTSAEVMTAFIGQFYAAHQPPILILTSIEPDETEVLEAALRLKREAGGESKTAVKLETPQRGEKATMLGHAMMNARQAHARRVAESASLDRNLDELARRFELEAPPQRIEIYDNSHISGTNAVGVMVVATPEGFQKNAYRKYTMKGFFAAPTIDPNDPATTVAYRGGDDFAMMREMLGRRFGRLAREQQGDEAESARDSQSESGDQVLPDLLLIDGGPGQIAVARESLDSLGFTGVAIIGIAKGPDRNAGREKFYRIGHEPLEFAPNDPLLFYLQRLRDEAHRFAIGTHRAKRNRSALRSDLDEIHGIGPKRRRALLHHFGSASAVRAAALSDLQMVVGISHREAEKIYSYFHPESS